MTQQQVRSRPEGLGVRTVSEGEDERLENLWQLYRYDLSEFRDSLPDGSGRFREHDMRTFLEGDPDRAGYLLAGFDVSAGFALVTGVEEGPRWMDHFFVARRARRLGLGRELALEVLHRHPGEWRIGFQEENPAAARFWRRLATDLVGDRWSEEAVPVPGKPWIPHDRVLHLTVK